VWKCPAGLETVVPAGFFVNDEISRRVDIMVAPER
jgi:hypothetical protein